MGQSFSIPAEKTEKYKLRLEFGSSSSKIIDIQHGRYLETWYLEAGRDLGTTEADTEVGVL